VQTDLKIYDGLPPFSAKSSGEISVPFSIVSRDMLAKHSNFQGHISKGAFESFRALGFIIKHAIHISMPT
jgi:hypothetical protein